ncbi:MAG: hypothetical protein Rhims3KO_14000 [Hyphomicrobiales bacterium]
MIRFLLCLGLVFAIVPQGFVPQSLAQTRLTVPPANWCVYDGESIWHDRRVDAQEIARITIDIECEDNRVARLRVKTETKCRPAYCSWNFAEDVFVSGGTIRAVFLTFTAQRSMRIQLAGNRINVEVENDYNQAGRMTDYMRTTLPLED